MGSGGYRHLGDEMFVVDPNFMRGKIPYDPLDSFQHQFNEIKKRCQLVLLLFLHTPRFPKFICNFWTKLARIWPPL